MATPRLTCVDPVVSTGVCSTSTTGFGVGFGRGAGFGAGVGDLTCSADWLDFDERNEFLWTSFAFIGSLNNK